MNEEKKWQVEFDEIVKNTNYSDYKVTDRFCCGGDYCMGDHNSWIKSFIAKTIQSEREALRKSLEETFDGCACGFHGYTVLPDCDKEKHKDCARCLISNQV